MTNRTLEKSLSPLFSIKNLGSSTLISKNLYYGDTLNGILTFKNSDNLEIPIYGAYTSIHTIIYVDTDIIYLPIKPSEIPSKKYRTPGMLFKNLIAFTSINRCISSRNEVYYGGNGIIMDSNKKPILLCVLKGKKEDFGVNFTEFIIYINPKVFYSTNTLEKFIVSKVIPKITSKKAIPSDIYSTYRNIKYNFITRNYEIEPKIIISSDINKFFVDHRPDAANIILQNNIDSLLEFIDYV